MTSFDKLAVVAKEDWSLQAHRIEVQQLEHQLQEKSGVIAGLKNENASLQAHMKQTTEVTCRCSSHCC